VDVAFLVTSLIVVGSPGTGVLYTLAAGLSRGPRASVVAAFGCTLGIVPHLAAAGSRRRKRSSRLREHDQLSNSARARLPHHLCGRGCLDGTGRSSAGRGRPCAAQARLAGSQWRGSRVSPRTAHAGIDLPDVLGDRGREAADHAGRSDASGRRWTSSPRAVRSNGSPAADPRCGGRGAQGETTSSTRSRMPPVTYYSSRIIHRSRNARAAAGSSSTVVTTAIGAGATCKRAGAETRCVASIARVGLLVTVGGCERSLVRSRPMRTAAVLRLMR
jgi:hypothetical protein